MSMATSRCVGSDVSADLHEHGELLTSNGQVSGDSNGEGGAEPPVPQGNPNSSHGASNGSLGETVGSTAGEQVTSPVSSHSVLQYSIRLQRALNIE